jgi:hypothetical protein
VNGLMWSEVTQALDVLACAPESGVARASRKNSCLAWGGMQEWIHRHRTALGTYYESTDGATGKRAPCRRLRANTASSLPPPKPPEPRTRPLRVRASRIQSVSRPPGRDQACPETDDAAADDYAGPAIGPPSRLLRYDYFKRAARKLLVVAHALVPLRRPDR